MIGSAALFALLHGLNPNMTFLAVFNIFLAGCFFSALIYSTESYLELDSRSYFGYTSQRNARTRFFLHSGSIAKHNNYWGNFRAEASISTTLFLLVLIVGLLLYAYKTKRMKKYTAVYQ